MWPYKTVTREEFERRKAFVAQVMTDLGCETLKTAPSVYRYRDGYYRVSEVLLQKPFIVLEYAETWDEVMKNCMEDIDPFPYDLSDEEIRQELKYELGLEPYPQIETL